MSDKSYTPRTDAINRDGNWYTQFYRMEHHARELERENAELREALRKATEEVVAMTPTFLLPTKEYLKKWMEPSKPIKGEKNE